MHRTGFTLAELLIALLILGVIATFTIPKILNNQQSSQKKSVFIESIAMLSEITYHARLDNLGISQAKTYYLNRINGIKICQDSQVEGCWPQSDATLPAGQVTQGGALLANGATVAGISNGQDLGSGELRDTLILDWNGASGPNTVGNDQIALNICYGTGICAANGNQASGTVKALGTSGSSFNLYNEIFAAN